MKVNSKLFVAILSLSVFVSCGKSTALTRSYPMGEKVQAGPLIYTALDAEWKTELGEGDGKVLPKDRFLIIHLSITNSGGHDAASPLCHLIDKQGNEIGELQEVKDVPQWLGLLRRLVPAATETGRIVFDAPLGIYKLRVSDGGDLESEKTELIDIPLELNAAPIMPQLAVPEANPASK